MEVEVAAASWLAASWHLELGLLLAARRPLLCGVVVALWLDLGSYGFILFACTS